MTESAGQNSTRVEVEPGAAQMSFICRVECPVALRE
jgi:hypothetical protein